MFGRSGSTGNSYYDERDRICNELKRRLHLARCAHNLTEERRIIRALKKKGVSV